MSKIHRKTVTIEFNASCVYPKKFIDYTFKNGRHVYVACGHLTTKEDGNKLFVESKKNRSVKRIIAKGEIINLEDEIKYYEGGIDPYTCYIDDPKQEQEAIKNNKYLREIVNALKGKEI